MAGGTFTAGFTLVWKYDDCGLWCQWLLHYDVNDCEKASGIEITSTYIMKITFKKKKKIELILYIFVLHLVILIS